MNEEIGSYQANKLDLTKVTFTSPRSMQEWFAISRLANELGLRDQIFPHFYRQQLIAIMCKTADVAIQIKLTIA